MSSREFILNRIKQNTKKKNPMPHLGKINPIVFENRVEMFCNTIEMVGGKYHLLSEGESVDDVIKTIFPEANKIASTLADVKSANINPDQYDLPVELNGIDVAIVNGAYGVAENAAIWLPKDVKHKALYFISEALVIVIDRNKLVDTMHDAYREFENEKFDFGIFISGPSKTADIEQALVFGAHGARELLVILK